MTGYERQLYADVSAIRKAQERLADIAEARYLREVIAADRLRTGLQRNGLGEQLRAVERRLWG